MDSSRQLPEHIIELIIAKELDRATKQQEIQLNQYWKEAPEMQIEGDTYARIIRSSIQMKTSKEIDQEKAWDLIIDEYDRKQSGTRRIVRYRWLKYAAVLLPFIILSGLLFININKKQKEVAQYIDMVSTVRESKAILVLSSGETVRLDGSLVGSTIEKEGAVIRGDQKDRISYSSAEKASLHRLIVPRGGEYQLVLPDGSVVFVNSDSYIEYPTVFEGDVRQVTLEGEAFFMVAPDPNKPFVVESPDFSITVTGTDFNVYNYPDDMATTTLVNGSVTVSSALSDGVELKPGQQAFVSHLDNQLTILDVDVGLYTSWVEGVFVFKDMPLSDLVKRMERWYDVDIVFKNVEAGKTRFTGAMEKNTAFKDIVWLIEQSANVSFEIKGNKAVIQ